jgi:hypothetical protein
MIRRAIVATAHALASNPELVALAVLALARRRRIAPRCFARRLLGCYERGRSAPGLTHPGTMTPRYSPRCSFMACSTHPAWLPGFPCWSPLG